MGSGWLLLLVVDAINSVGYVIFVVVRVLFDGCFGVCLFGVITWYFDCCLCRMYDLYLVYLFCCSAITIFVCGCCDARALQVRVLGCLCW